MGRFTERVRRTLTGEEPSKSDIEKQAADELRRAGTRPGAPPGSPGGPPLPVKPSPASRTDAPSEGAPDPPVPPPAPRPRTAPPTPPSSPPSTAKPSPPSSSPAAPKPAPSSPPDTKPAASGFAAPSESQTSLTPEEERQALNDMALEDLGGPAADGGGLQVDPAEAEAMRDRALAQYLERKKALDRERERKAAQQAEEAARQAEAPSVEAAEERLMAVPGLGPAKIDALLEEFESFEAVAQADEAELVQVNGIGQRLAAEIVATLR